MTRTVLVTGVAGFIGYHTALRLLNEGNYVVGIDNLSDYYDVSLKQDRLHRLQQLAGFQFILADLIHREAIEDLFQSYKPQSVVHLAAQVGVRASLETPRAYIDSNIIGFLNILECCRHHAIQHLVYASSSSVYGNNTKVPYSVRDCVDHPISLYAATKRSNELMAHTYSHLFGLPTTGLRFFTVYGPWGRPDMAIFRFARAITEGKEIDVYNHGNMVRDFTFIDDVVEGVLRTLDRVAAPDPEWNSEDPCPATSTAPYRIYNIGNHSPVPLMDVIEALEAALGKRARKKFLTQQPGDMLITHADVSDLAQDIGYSPATDLHKGIKSFVDWFCEYYKIGR